MAIFAHNAQMCKMVIKSGKIYVFSALIVVCILVAVGCERVIEATTQDEIVFEPSIEAEVKGYELTSASLLDFGVYATLEDEGVDFDESNNLESFMDNVLVEKGIIGESVAWVTNPKYYWPMIGGKKLSFFAYAPYSANSSEFIFQADWENEKNLKIQYAPHSNPTRQVDLCVSKAVLDRDNIEDRDKVIPFLFDHTLTWVTFSANYNDEDNILPDECYLRIDELSIYNLVGTNTLVITSSSGNDYFYWNSSVSADPDVIYTLQVDNGLAPVALSKKVDENSVYTSFVAPSGNLFLLPQKINPGVTPGEIKTMIGVAFSFVRSVDNKNIEIAQFYAEKELPRYNATSEWVPGKKIRYNFTIELKNISLVNITPVVIEDWKDSENVHNNNDEVVIQ